VNDAGKKAGYDVFLSFAGPDRRTGRDLTRTLRGLGLRVFLDEDDIDVTSSITSSLEVALGSAKLLVAYYSAKYAARPACQLELMAAFLAGLREGDPLRRILVINPEQSSDHVLPVQLADARYALPPLSVEDTTALAKKIAHCASAVDGVIGEVSMTTRSRWFGRQPSAGREFLGRFREMWAVHSALCSTNFPGYLEMQIGLAVAICGLPGAGKTALAATYAWQFGAAYPGGVYWLSLAGKGGSSSDVLSRYSEEVRGTADALRVDPGQNPLSAVADRLADERRPSLWIIDDLPPGLDPAILDRLLLPAGSAVRTILIGDEDVFGAVLPVVAVGPLTAPDASTVLTSHRRPSSQAERMACDRLAHTLGHHAGAVVEAGRRLQDRQGLVSYAEFEAALLAGDDVLPATSAALRELGARLTPDERLVMDVAAICGPTGLPARLMKRVGDQRGVDVGTALVRMRRRAIAERTGTIWWLNPMVVRLHAGGDYVGNSRLRTVVARVVREMLTDGRLTEEERHATEAIELFPFTEQVCVPVNAAANVTDYFSSIIEVC
jgi:hypothetical protein